MARRGIKTAIRVGGTAPLVLGAFVLDPSAAAAATCDATVDGSLRCSDETLGDLAVATRGTDAALSYSNDAVSADAAASPRGIAVDCVVCTIDVGPVKGHPACLSGFDPVVDPWIEEVVDKILQGGS